MLPIARNRCVEKFISANATHMLFLDDDVGVFASDVITLMDLDVEFSAIPYNKREAEFSGAISAVQGITLRTNPSVLASLLSVPTSTS